MIELFLSTAPHVKLMYICHTELMRSIFVLLSFPKFFSGETQIGGARCRRETFCGMLIREIILRY